MFNAHPLCEFEALVKIDGEAWAEQMQRWLRLSKRVLERGHRWGGVVSPPPWKLLERRYDERVQEAWARPEGLPQLPTGCRGCMKRRLGHPLAWWLQRRRASILRFLFDWRVPCTTNQTEQDLHKMELWRKISGGARRKERRTSPR